MKCVYRAIMSLDPTGKGQARWTMRWKTALNAFDITFDGRLSRWHRRGRGAVDALNNWNVGVSRMRHSWRFAYVASR